MVEKTLTILPCLASLYLWLAHPSVHSEEKIPESPPSTRQIACARCKGQTTVPCEICKSKGKTKQKCKKCNRGKVPCISIGCPKDKYHPGMVNCSLCSGKRGREETVIHSNGVVEKKWIACKTCKSAGAVDCRNCEAGFNACRECAGTGSVYPDCNACGGTGAISCALCSGSGKVNAPPLSGQLLNALEDYKRRALSVQNQLSPKLEQLEDLQKRSQGDRDDFNQSLDEARRFESSSTAMTAELKSLLADWIRETERCQKNLPQPRGKEWDDLQATSEQSKQSIEQAKAVVSGVELLASEGMADSRKILDEKVAKVEKSVFELEASARRFGDAVATLQKKRELLLSSLKKANALAENFRGKNSAYQNNLLAQEQRRESSKKQFAIFQKQLPRILEDARLPEMTTSLDLEKVILSGSLEVGISQVEPESALVEKNLEQIPTLVSAVFKDCGFIDTLVYQIKKNSLDKFGHPALEPLQQFTFVRNDWLKLTDPVGAYRNNWRKLLELSQPVPKYPRRFTWSFQLVQVLAFIFIPVFCLTGIISIFGLRYLKRNKTWGSL